LTSASSFLFAFSAPAQQQHTVLSEQCAEKTNADTQKQAAVLHHFPLGFSLHASSRTKAGAVKVVHYDQRD
jgi:hypothetical protein